MLKRMYIADYIYKGVVEPYYKKNTRVDATRAGRSIQKRGEASSSNTYSEISESNEKYRKRYVDYPRGKSKTCLMHVPVNSSDKCKVLGDFGFKYVNSRPTKDGVQTKTSYFSTWDII